MWVELVKPNVVSSQENMNMHVEGILDVQRH